MLRSDSTEQLQSMILSTNKIYSWKPPVLLFGHCCLKTCLRGFRSIRLDKNWPAQSQKPRVLAYSNLSNHTLQVTNNKSIDKTARLICTFIVCTCSLQVAPGGFSRRGSNTKVGYHTKTCLYNVDPLKPHFYIVKLWFTRVYIIFHNSAQKHRLWVLIRTASSKRF